MRGHQGVRYKTPEGLDGLLKSCGDDFKGEIEMAGPGKKGQLFKRQCQELTQNPELEGSSKKHSSKSPNSDPSTFYTSNSSPLGRGSEEIVMQPQTSESHAFGQNEVLSSLSSCGPRHQGNHYSTFVYERGGHFC